MTEDFTDPKGLPEEVTHIDGKSPAGDVLLRVGQRVKILRKEARMSRRVLSEKSGVSARYLAKLEAGDGNISIGLLQAVADALSTPMVALLSGGIGSEEQRVAALFGQADAGTQAEVLRLLQGASGGAQKGERVCLIGLRGAGKSTLGARVAGQFDAPFVELNAEIEAAAGMAVGEIMALYGAEGYRQLEADTLAQIAQSHPRAVVAVAGGIVSDPDTFAGLLAQFHTVWLRAAPEEHMARVRAQGDMRPMAGNPEAMTQLRQILASREEAYGRAEFQLDTSGKSADESAVDLAQLIKAEGLLGR